MPGAVAGTVRIPATDTHLRGISKSGRGGHLGSARKGALVLDCSVVRVAFCLSFGLSFGRFSAASTSFISR